MNSEIPAMQNRLNLRQWYPAFCVGVALIASLVSANMYADENRSVSDVITRLIRMEEFKEPERDQVDALPIESVPILITALMNIPPGGDDQRQFYLLGKKVEQFESKLEAQSLTSAVNALLDRIKPADVLTEQQAVNLRIKLKALSGIADSRIVEGVRQAHAALAAAQEKYKTPEGRTANHSPGRTVTRTMDSSSGTQTTSRIERSSAPNCFEAKPTAPPKPFISITWIVWTAVIVASIGLLCLVVRKWK